MPDRTLFRRTLRRAATAGAVAVLGVTIAAAAAPSAYADTVQSQGNTTATKYRAGDPAKGGISYAVGLQVAVDAKGHKVNVRAVGRITKLKLVKSVQVDKVTLGTANRGLLSTSRAINSGSKGAALNYTGWYKIAPGSCVSYRAKAELSIRWSDNQLSKLTVLSPLSQVCRPAPPPPPAPAPAPAPTPAVPPMPSDRDCSDFGSQAAAQAFFNYYYPYYGDFANLDADGDLKACESLP